MLIDPVAGTTGKQLIVPLTSLRVEGLTSNIFLLKLYMEVYFSILHRYPWHGAPNEFSSI